MIENIVPEINPTAQKTEVGVKNQQEYKYKGSVRLRRGMKIYSFNPETTELKEVELTGKVIVDLKGSPHKKLQTTYNPKCWYIQAINYKNAQRKVDKALQRLKMLYVYSKSKERINPDSKRTI
jgi:hypothetical protein